MILKRKIYDKLLTLKNELNGKKAFLIEGARIGECYVIHPRNLSFKDDIVCIPPYMTICL